MSSPWAFEEPAVQAPRYELASWGSRVGAFLLDLIILMVGGFVVGVVVVRQRGRHQRGGRRARRRLRRLPALRAADADLQRRPDDRQEGARHRRDQRGRAPIGFGRALWREIFSRWLLAVTIIGGILDPLWPLWDDQNRALHDFMAKTRVIIRD